MAFYPCTPTFTDKMLHYFCASVNYAKRLRKLKGVTPHQHRIKIWQTEPEKFKRDPYHITIKRDCTYLSSDAEKSVFSKRRVNASVLSCYDTGVPGLWAFCGAAGGRKVTTS